jgi:hypothetical protein
MPVNDSLRNVSFFQVYLLSSMRTRVAVVLAFSEEGLEVYPKQARAGAIFWKSRKPVVHSMEGKRFPVPLQSS